MRYDLAGMARRHTNRDSITLRPIDPPITLAKPLLDEGNAIITGIRNAVKQQLLPVYQPKPLVGDSVMMTDGIWDQITGALEAVKVMGRRLATTIDARINPWAVRVEQFHRARFSANVRAGAGVDVVAMLHGADAEEEVQSALRWASSLIRDVDEQLLQKVESRTWAAYANQTPRRELAKQLANDMGVSRKRAELIARDQTTKLASNLDQMRSLEAGLGDYIWKHSHKAHPRLEHVARDGKEFAWNDPPADGHPGQAVNCGCRALPVLKFD